MEPSELYQQIILDHARHPRHRGGCTGATHHARAENPNCGDEVEVHLRLSAAGLVEELTFTGQGCALSQASASLLTTKLRGRSPAQALETVAAVQCLLAGAVLGADRLDALGDLQALAGAAQFPQRVKCASLAWQALGRALAAGGAVRST